MQIATSSLRLAVLAAACALAGCASTDYHYSQLTGSRYFRAPIDTYPLTIVRVDGKSVLGSGPTIARSDGNDPSPKSFSLVDPGRREVTVQGPPGGAGGIGETRTVPMEIAACTRYYLVAVKSNALASDFTVKVDHEEPVSGCTAPRS